MRWRRSNGMRGRLHRSQHCLFAREETEQLREWSSFLVPQTINNEMQWKVYRGNVQKEGNGFYGSFVF